MNHYVCTGNCGGEAEKPGVCQVEGCTKADQPLELCTCEDGIHEDVVRDVPEDELEIDADTE